MKEAQAGSGGVRGAAARIKKAGGNEKVKQVCNSEDPNPLVRVWGKEDKSDDEDDFSAFRTPGGKEGFLTPKSSKAKKEKQKQPVTKIVKGPSAEFLERHRPTLLTHYPLPF